MCFDLHPPTLPDNNSLPGLINMDFNHEEDNDIIGCLKTDYAFWWNRRILDDDVEDPPLMYPEVNWRVIEAHFQHFFDTVSDCFYESLF
jgi:hypothetical protein